MENVNLGESVLIEVVFLDKDRLPMPATGVVIQAKRPDGTVINGDVMPGVGTGEFEARITTDAAGIWIAKAECAGPTVVKKDARFRVNALRFDTP